MIAFSQGLVNINTEQCYKIRALVIKCMFYLYFVINNEVKVPIL
jgi:hypothetical protein